jgi:class 3 adenylate cyclase
MIRRAGSDKYEMSKKKEEAQETLDVGDDASTRTIRVSFRKKARELQDGVSDLPRSKKSFQELNEAYKTLMGDREAGVGLTPKRVTILSSDVAEYSRMTAEDEEDTIQFFSFCQEAFEEIVGKHGGRVFNTAGDAILAEFSNVSNAVECAVEIQRELRAMNLGRADGRRIQFRIGLNFGEVFEHGEDLLGDTVNVAARIQTAAKPGGVCLSQNVFELLGNNSGHSVHSLGELTFKNIPEPIHTYALTSGGAPATMPALPGAAAPAAVARKPVAKKKSRSASVEAESSGSFLKTAGIIVLFGVGVAAGWKLLSPPRAVAPSAVQTPPKEAEVAPAPLTPPVVEAKAKEQRQTSPSSTAASPASSVEESVVKEAEQGDLNSNYRRGTAYLKEQKFVEAALLFQVSSQKGHMGSQYELGMLYQAGSGVPKDAEASVYWLLHAALAGNGVATQFLQAHRSDFSDYATYIVNQPKIDANRRPAETMNLRRQAEVFLQGLHDTLRDRQFPVMPGTW